MDNIDSIQTEDISFGKEIAKMFVSQTVASAAVWTGLGVVLFAGSKIADLFQKRRSEKNLIEN